MNEDLELYLERARKIKKEKEQYQAKCETLGMGTDEEAFDKVLDIIKYSSLSEEEKEIISNYIENWYGCYENEYL